MTKHEFPKNWSKISEEEAIKHIKYLLAHYKEYDIKKVGDDSIRINDIYIMPLDIPRDYFTFKYFIINMERTYSSFDEIYYLIEQLMYVCNIEIEIRKLLQQEQEEQQKQYKKQKLLRSMDILFFCIMLVLLFIRVSFKSHNGFNKQKKIDNQVQEYKKTLSNCQDYKITKSLLKNYRDNLQQVIK